VQRLRHPCLHQISSNPGQSVHVIEIDVNWDAGDTDSHPHRPAEELEPLYNVDQAAREVRPRTESLSECPLPDAEVAGVGGVGTGGPEQLRILVESESGKS
jgi:hypothetical protein